MTTLIPSRRSWEQAYRDHEDDPAPSPQQTTETDVVNFIVECTHHESMTRHLPADFWLKRPGDDQLEIRTVDGSVFQINVNRLR